MGVGIPGIFEHAIEEAKKKGLDLPISLDQYLFASTLFSAMEVAAVACLPRSKVSAFKTKMMTEKKMDEKLAEVVKILGGNDQMRQLSKLYSPAVEKRLAKSEQSLNCLGIRGLMWADAVDWGM